MLGADPDVEARALPDRDPHDHVDHQVEQDQQVPAAVMPVIALSQLGRLRLGIALDATRRQFGMARRHQVLAVAPWAGLFTGLFAGPLGGVPGRRDQRTLRRLVRIETRHRPAFRSPGAAAAAIAVALRLRRMPAGPS
jgi:hypothetical protein